MTRLPPLRRLLRTAVVALAAAPLAVCAPAPAFLMSTGPERPSYLSTVAFPATMTARAVSDHVIVISIDGLRADAIEKAGAHTLQRLMREGAYSLEATTILPSITLPSHTSMLTGAAPEMHGVLWNDERMDEMGLIETPTMFAVARAAGYSTAAFFAKPKFHHLMVPGTLDYAQAPKGDSRWFVGYTAESVEKYLDEEQPNLTFVHIGEPDFAGHTIGWGSMVYRWAVRRADGAVGRILRKADEAFGAGNYTVVITADHGGHGRTHGTEAPEDVTIPWIAWGKGVAGGTVLPVGIRTFDTAATALRLLGLDIPPAHAGRPVMAALDARTIPAPNYAGGAGVLPPGSGAAVLEASAARAGSGSAILEGASAPD